MESVSLSNVNSVGYDYSEDIVYVKFLNGSMYRYYDVPKYEY